MKCKYCGDLLYDRGYSKVCGRCAIKTSLLPSFIKARDDLRVLCGLERMSKNEKI